MNPVGPLSIVLGKSITKQQGLGEAQGVSLELTRQLQGLTGLDSPDDDLFEEAQAFHLSSTVPEHPSADHITGMLSAHAGEQKMLCTISPTHQNPATCWKSLEKLDNAQVARHLRFLTTPLSTCLPSS
jgi:hypothetical protein